MMEFVSNIKKKMRFMYILTFSTLMLILPYPTCTAGMPAGCSVFLDFLVSWLVTARNCGIAFHLAGTKHFHYLERIWGIGLFLWEAEGINRSSVNCIFFLWICHLKCCCEILKQVDQRGCETSNLWEA